MANLLENLNKEQIQAVMHGEGPLLIVAGAGTGKTTVITRRIAYLMEQELAKPDEILALTFTEKAAGEMQERLDLLMPLGYQDMWISTFHSFGQRLLDQHGADIGLPGDFKILTETGAWVMLFNNFDKFQLDYYRPLGNPKKFISALLKHFSKCKDELITPGEYLEFAQKLRLSTDTAVKTKNKSKIAGDAGAAEKTPEADDEAEIARLEEIANAYHVYQKLLLDQNFLDFADLINYTLELFKKRPKILSYYQKKFKYILIDEFQDTNYAQYQLVRLLAGQSGNLAVVGDDDQSIYKFRGASVSNILKFQEDYPKLKQVTLVKNYRSCQGILDLAYSFIQANNPDRLEEKLKISKKLEGQTDKLCEIKVLEGKDLSDELNLVAKKILELKNGQLPASSADMKSPAEVSWNDFAVLIRSNAAAEELLPVLAASGIPHTFVASTGLYKKPLIADLIAYMKLLDNFHDSFSLYRVLGFADFGLKPDTLPALLQTAEKRTLSLYEVLVQAQVLPDIDADTKANIAKFITVLHSHSNEAQGRSATEVFVDIVRDLKLERKLEAETLENAENRELLEQFYKKIEGFVRDNSDKSLHYFLHVLDLEQEAGDQGQLAFDPNLGPESLKILTVHAAKGLEFENVFIINLVDQRFPTRARHDTIEIPEGLVKDILPEGDFHLQEERRLFYVSLTRAKSHLYLTWAKDYGGKTLKKPSQFLLETKLVPSEKVSKATGKVIFTKPAKTAIVYKQLPRSYSFSAVKAFKNCPLEYKYKYYLKFPTKGTHYLSFGQTIHLTFEAYLKDYLKKLNTKQQDLFGVGVAKPALGSFDFLKELYEQNWVDEWYQTKAQKERYREKGREMLKTFYQELQARQPEPKFVEQKFSLQLGQFTFVGKIDRADAVPGGIAIFDYKTGEKIPAKTGREDLDQLYIYQWAAQEHLHENVKRLCYWYLDDNKFLEEEVASPEEIAKLKAGLLETIEKINDCILYDRFKDEHQKTKEHHCDYENLE